MLKWLVGWRTNFFPSEVCFLALLPLFSWMREAQQQQILFRTKEFAITGGLRSRCFCFSILNRLRSRFVKLSAQQLVFLFVFFSFFFALKCVCFSRMITSIISYGIVFNTEKLSGSPYLNIIIVGSLRYFVNICAAIIDVKFMWAGRRLLHGVSMASISSCLGIVFAVSVIGEHLK